MFWRKGQSNFLAKLICAKAISWLKMSSSGLHTTDHNQNCPYNGDCYEKLIKINKSCREIGLVSMLTTALYNTMSNKNYRSNVSRQNFEYFSDTDSYKHKQDV